MIINNNYYYIVLVSGPIVLKSWMFLYLINVNLLSLNTKTSVMTTFIVLLYLSSQRERVIPDLAKGKEEHSF